MIVIILNNKLWIDPHICLLKQCYDILLINTSYARHLVVKMCKFGGYLGKFGSKLNFHKFCRKQFGPKIKNKSTL